MNRQRPANRWERTITGDVRFGVAATLFIVGGLLAIDRIPEPPPPQHHDYQISIYKDPCPPTHWNQTTPAARRARTECWIRYAFPPAEWDTALRVADIESGGTFHPHIRNYDQHLEDEGYRWTEIGAKPVPAAARKQSRVYGIFQHRWEFWPERAQRAAAYYGQPAAARHLDPFEGWHNVLVAAWLAGDKAEGWRHWHYCDVSRQQPRPKNPIRCGPGRWINEGDRHRFAAIARNPQPRPQPAATLYIRFKATRQPPKPGVEPPARNRAENNHSAAGTQSPRALIAE